MSTLPPEALPGLREWLPRQRWFAGRGQPVTGLAVLDERALDAELTRLLLRVTTPTHDGDYQVLFAVAHRLPDQLRPAEFARVGERSYFDAVADPELAGRLLDFDVAPEPGVELHSGLRARLCPAEQSNSSLVFGHDYIFKLYRRVHPGPNRDVEMHRALTSVGCEHIADPLGTSTMGDYVLGFLQRYLGDAAEGWLTATTSVRDLMAEADLHAAEVGGDFAGEAARLGTVVADVHADLARALGERTISEEDAATVVEAMRRRLATTLDSVAELAPYAAAVRATFDAARPGLPGTAVQEVHGDLHLGQALRSAGGWTLIDFEGEPAGSLADRSAPRSPLVDVAGMLRSFDYAAHQWMAGRDPAEAEAPVAHQWGFRASEWARRNIDAFCTGYAERSLDPRSAPELLRAFELDKAVYEVGYEHAHRPEWLTIPLSAVARLTGHE